jgi:outer membrane protein TolC
MNRITILFVAALIPLCTYGQSVEHGLSLRDALAIGLQRSPEVRIAEEEVIAARGRFWAGVSLPSPELSVQHEYIPVGMGLGRYSERTVAISQSFEFPTNYFLKGSILAQDEDIAMAFAQQASRRKDGAIKAAYFAAWGARKRLQYAHDNVVLSDSIMAKVELRFRVGEASPIERLTARVQQSEAKNEFTAARNGLLTAYAGLNGAMGFSTLQYDTSIVLTDSILVSHRELAVDSLISLVEKRNPALQAARSRVERASASRTLAWSTVLPSFSVSYFRQAKDGVGDYYGASVGVSIPLWFMFDTRGKVQESQAGVSIAEAESEGLRTKVLVDLRNAVRDVQNSANSVRLYQEDLIPQAEEVSRTAARGYTSGDLSYLEYLQARVTLIAVQRDFLSALLAHQASVTFLDEIVGEPLPMNMNLEKP